MNDDDQADAIRGLPPEVRSDIAAVWRTVEWHVVDPKRIAQAMHVGATCVRLIGRCLKHDSIQGEVRDTLTNLNALLVGLDAAEPEKRAGMLAEVRQGLQSLISIGEIGARRQGLTRVGRLIKPSGRRGRGKSRAAAASDKDAQQQSVQGAEVLESTVKVDSDEKAKQGASKSDADGQKVPKDSRDAAQGGGDDRGARGDERGDDRGDDRGARGDDRGARGDERGARGDERGDERGDRAERRPRRAPEPRVRKLPIGDPEGTGRLLSELTRCNPDFADKLRTVGLETIFDLLNQAPKDHHLVAQLDIAEDSDPATVVTDAEVMLRGRVHTRCTRLSAEGARSELILDHHDGVRVRCVWTGAKPRGWDVWSSGMVIALIGLVEHDDSGWSLTNAESVGVDGRGSGWLPTYDIADVDERSIRDLVAEALTSIKGSLRDFMPDRLIERYRLLPIDQAFREAHFPSNMAGKGRGRLAFDELLMLQAGIAWRGRSRQRTRGRGLDLVHKIVGDLEAQLDFVLTDSQESAFSDIRRGLKSNQPMVRLLQGEVGTDKASIAILSAVLVADSKAQVAYILPDDMAAERRHLFSEGMLKSVGIGTMRITGSPDHGQLDAIARGNCQIVFGTKKVLDANPEWHRLGLVIVEERDEYGTVDPAQFSAIGTAPDLLVITDTPIPSSLALTIFGEYEVSLVTRDGPIGVPAQTHSQDERAAAYTAAREVVEDGGQAYVCFPVGESGDLLSTEDALRFAEALQTDAFPEARIGVYCSTMSGEDRLRVFHDFEERRIDVLICTTYIEEAPVVPNAIAMVIEHADSHELIRLHRLRGHVGHGRKGGVCLLITSENPTDAGLARVQQVMSESDGFRIAEIDLRERGASVILGERARELPVFCWTDPVQDRALLLSAREESFGIVREDPSMRRWADFGRAIHYRWGRWLGPGLPDPSTAKSGGSGGGRRRRRRRR